MSNSLNLQSIIVCLSSDFTVGWKGCHCLIVRCMQLWCSDRGEESQSPVLTRSEADIHIFVDLFFWKININLFKLCSLNSFGMFGGGLGTQRFIACGGQRLTVEVLSVFQRVELFMFFPTKNEFSLKIPEMVVSRVVFAESEAALLFVKLYCIWFSFYISIK